jgi:hypothetical protein
MAETKKVQELPETKICLLGISQEALVAVPFGLEWHVAVNGDWSKQTVETELAYLSPDDERPSGSPWTVKLVGNIFLPVYHNPLSSRGVPHPDKFIDYFSWDGQWWRADVLYTYSGQPSFTFNHSLLKVIIPARPLPPGAVCQGATPEAK